MRAVRESGESGPPGSAARRSSRSSVVDRGMGSRPSSVEFKEGNSGIVAATFARLRLPMRRSSPRRQTRRPRGHLCGGPLRPTVGPIMGNGVPLASPTNAPPPVPAQPAPGPWQVQPRAHGHQLTAIRRSAPCMRGRSPGLPDPGETKPHPPGWCASYGSCSIQETAIHRFQSLPH
jgi:hypothetical protein